MMNRTDRKRQRRFDVLRQLVDRYIETCAPVSSEQICRNLTSSVSSATIRNTLSELDDLEWTTQPHSSSGRVPSAKGFRAYVDTLRASDMSERDFGKALSKHLADFEMSSVDIGSGLQKVAAVLSELAGCCGVVLAPGFENDFIRQIRLLPIDNSRVLVVLVSDFGIVRTETMQIGRKLSYFSQRRIEEFLNARLHGTASGSEFTCESYDEDELKLGETVYNEIVLKYLISARPRGGNEVFLEGISRLFDSPEFQRPKAVQEVISFLEDRDRTVESMRQVLQRRKMDVRIGEELTGPDGDIGVSFAIVAAPYRLNSINVGSLGVIGPMRMPYKAVIPLVRQSADFLSAKLAMNFRKPRLAFDRDIPFKIV